MDDFYAEGVGRLSNLIGQASFRINRRGGIKMSYQSSETEVRELTFGYSRALDSSFDQALERTREALQKEGFGVLFEIDLKEKMKEKLGVEFRNYLILGACNPAFAYRSLQEDIAMGLLLPCNVIVYEEAGRPIVAAVSAIKLMSVVGNPRVEQLALEVDHKLTLVIKNL